MSETDGKKVTVEQANPNTFDLGNLATFNPNPLDNLKLQEKGTREEHLREVTRDSTQLLINQILSLPVSTTSDSLGSSGSQTSTLTLIKLPEPTTRLPREKPLPKPKPPTKWELFAAKKGIKPKSKEGKMVFDEETGEWVPKWGYKGRNKKIDDQWLVELKDKPSEEQDGPGDPRKLSRAERKKLVKKNTIQQARNLKNNAK